MPKTKPKRSSRIARTLPQPEPHVTRGHRRRQDQSAVTTPEPRKKAVCSTDFSSGQRHPTSRTAGPTHGVHDSKSRLPGILTGPTVGQLGLGNHRTESGFKLSSSL
ncbi:uncharacterized protein LOC130046585 [Ostrea edulis]|uniref:uncharacterized protein LOC130046585 n=1 Tax=Ostrea edulis TaxID=37623 RepID=UPI0024AF352E|nr:uncharacterized protein LOC130046585 [Ostrea edulis]